MELRAYLRTLIRKWWIVLIVFLITYGATLAFTFTQQPVYQSTATYVVKLNSLLSNDKDLASAVDILSRRTEIATTYTIVANSQQLKQLASQALGLSPAQRDDITVSSELVAGTNVLEITTQSHDPVLTRDFTNAVGAKLVSYARGLYETYTLEPLDPAGLPSAPIKPNKPLNLALGALMGLLLGTGMAFLAAYLHAPLESVTSLSVLDDATGVYNQRYLTMRLRQELSRAKRKGYPLSLALINVDRYGVLAERSAEVRQEVLRRVAKRLAPQLRDEDMMAHLDNSVFGLLLVDTAGEEAKEMIERLQALVDARPVELDRSGDAVDLRCCGGVVAYSAIDTHKTTEPGELMAEAERALKQAEAAAYSTVEVLPGPSEQLQAAAAV
jgi:diguanylate cyclase (GGDEF)-like protein